ncbi:PREDICTED: 50S ribosomal protein L15, chloroplastic-like isoform X2 [Populus euphratica]|uniref:50S ribosomal protein L15, chloroplastic-like isoform X2 n=1 Tax=Populus euphratica TaxID=75702 RepID=A0AAJ6XKD4_POPEU|nr:PREDICTED: 50S ribosomal protein L15, chloroplastic-like isoform X2 [Populus euphratica]
MAMAMAMAAASLPCPSSPFKGNLTRLKPKTCNFTFLTLHSKNKRPSVVVNQVAAPSVVTTSSGARLRLDNLGPQPGSRKKGKRKGRGISAGQGNSCGFGMRGQKSRSGPGVRKGFEGGQMPLYRRIPKLRGIAGGMHAGLPKYVPVNLKDIASAGFQEGEEVSLETLKEKGLINPSGRERRLPLKVSNQCGMIIKVNRCLGQALCSWAYYSSGSG